MEASEWFAIAIAVLLGVRWLRKIRRVKVTFEVTMK